MFALIVATISALTVLWPCFRACQKLISMKAFWVVKLKRDIIFAFVC